MKRNNKKRCVIIGGAPINNAKTIKSLLKNESDFYIYCDCGLFHEEKLKAPPNLIIGDFDSHEKPDTDTEIIVLPHEKDDTDTMYAAREGVKRGFDEFLLLGIIGARLDHTLGNLAVLLWLDGLGKKAEAADDYSDLEIVSSSPALISPHYKYFSLLAIDGKAAGISIKNAFYPLYEAELKPADSIGVSNEVLPEKTAEVCVQKGRLLLIKDRGSTFVPDF